MPCTRNISKNDPEHSYCSFHMSGKCEFQNRDRDPSEEKEVDAMEKEELDEELLENDDFSILQNTKDDISEDAMTRRLVMARPVEAKSEMDAEPTSSFFTKMTHSLYSMIFPKPVPMKPKLKSISIYFNFV